MFVPNKKEIRAILTVRVRPYKIEPLCTCRYCAWFLIMQNLIHPAQFHLEYWIMLSTGLSCTQNQPLHRIFLDTE